MTYEGSLRESLQASPPLLRVGVRWRAKQGKAAVFTLGTRVKSRVGPLYSQQKNGAGHCYKAFLLGNVTAI